MPADWDNVEFTRKWRGATYNFHYARVDGIDETILTVDGKKLDGNRLPVPAGKPKIDVLVEMPCVSIENNREINESLACSGCA